MGQMTFTDAEYANRKRVSKREQFLDTMTELLPWDDWVTIIEPYYYHNRVGRPPVGVETMLRMYLLQCWFSLSDEGLEDAIYDSHAMSRFMGVNFLDGQAPDATTLCKFRHLLEENGIGKKIFEDVKERLERAGLMMHGGSIVDATIIAAPSSTKNKAGKRDPEMRQAKKGGQWYFGAKAHVGVDAGSGLVHSVDCTAANVHDVTVAGELVREDDEVVYGDSGYLGVEKRVNNVEFKINRKPSSLKTFLKGGGFNADRDEERRKSSVRCKVEHVFLIIKRDFGYAKARYRGIAKNAERLYMLFALANILKCARAGRGVDFCRA